MYRQVETAYSKLGLLNNQLLLETNQKFYCSFMCRPIQILRQILYMKILILTLVLTSFVYQFNCECSLKDVQKWSASIISLQFGQPGQCEYHFEITVWSSGYIVLMEGNVVKTTKIWSAAANYTCVNYNKSNFRLTGTCNNDSLYLSDSGGNYYSGGKVKDRIQLSGKFGTIVFWK